jgi:hypothetical protein
LVGPKDRETVSEEVRHLLKQSLESLVDGYADPFIARIAEYHENAVPVLLVRLNELLPKLDWINQYEVRYIIRALRFVKAKTCLRQVVACTAKILSEEKGGAGILYECYWFIQEFGVKDLEAYAVLKKAVESVSAWRRTYIVDIHWDDALKILKGV